MLEHTFSGIEFVKLEHDQRILLEVWGKYNYLIIPASELLCPREPYRLNFSEAYSEYSDNDTSIGEYVATDAELALVYQDQQCLIWRKSTRYSNLESWEDHNECETHTFYILYPQ